MLNFTLMWFFADCQQIVQPTSSKQPFMWWISRFSCVPDFGDTWCEVVTLQPVWFQVFFFNLWKATRFVIGPIQFRRPAAHIRLLPDTIKSIYFFQNGKTLTHMLPLCGGQKRAAGALEDRVWSMSSSFSADFSLCLLIWPNGNNWVLTGYSWPHAAMCSCCVFDVCKGGADHGLYINMDNTSPVPCIS